MAQRYTVSIHIAAPGTPLKGGTASLAGYMFLVLAGSHGAPESYGFAPRADFQASGLGRVHCDDLEVCRDPYYSRTLEITQQQYELLHAFTEDPQRHGFDMRAPIVIHSSADFVRAALDHAGLHHKAAHDDRDPEGEFELLLNVSEVQSISAPFAGSELNTEEHNPVPTHAGWHRTRPGRAQDMGAPRPPVAPTTAPTPADPAHPDHRLLSQLNSKVAELDAANGRIFDATSERISANLLALAKQNNLSRVDHVLLSERTRNTHAAQNIFIVQGDRDDPGHRRASMPTEVAAKKADDEGGGRGE